MCQCMMSRKILFNPILMLSIYHLIFNIIHSLPCFFSFKLDMVDVERRRIGAGALVIGSGLVLLICRNFHFLTLLQRLRDLNESVYQGLLLSKSCCTEGKKLLRKIEYYCWQETERKKQEQRSLNTSRWNTIGQKIVDATR